MRTEKDQKFGIRLWFIKKVPLKWIVPVKKVHQKTALYFYLWNKPLQKSFASILYMKSHLNLKSPSILWKNPFENFHLEFYIKNPFKIYLAHIQFYIENPFKFFSEKKITTEIRPKKCPLGPSIRRLFFQKLSHTVWSWKRRGNSPTC